MRLFVPNFDFEDRLANRPRRGATDTLNAQLAARWWPAMSEADRIWTDAELTPPAGEFLPPGMSFPQTTPNHDPQAELVPWGFAARPADALKTIERANSKVAALRWEIERGLAPPGASVIKDARELESAIQSLQNNDRRWLVKSEFGMSGREQFRGEGFENLSQAQNWLAKRLARGERMLFEPWLTSTREVSLHFDVTDAGIREIGATELLAMPSGQHIGNRSMDRSDVPEEVRATCRAYAEFLGTLGYRGPLGIDAMQHADGWRTVQDSNARWTMGRLTLLWEQRLGSPVSWLHFPEDRPQPFAHFKDACPHGVEIWQTSADRVNDQSAAFRSLLLAGERAVLSEAEQQLIRNHRSRA